MNRMVCWLRFLQLVSGYLKELEPNLLRRKQLAIDLLKDLEKEEGHDIAKIKRVLDNEGKEGMLTRARKKRKRKQEDEWVDEQSESGYAGEEQEQASPGSPPSKAI